jgi:hypothetical protein
LIALSLVLFAFFHFPNRAVTDWLKAVNSVWLKMVALISTVGTLSWL